MATQREQFFARGVANPSIPIPPTPKFPENVHSWTEFNQAVVKFNTDLAEFVEKLRNSGSI